MKDAETGEIDYEYIRSLALEHKPKIILAGFSAYPGELDYDTFAEIGREVGALLMADMAHLAGLIAAGVAQNPLDHGFHVMTTTTHKTLRGPRGGMILSKGAASSPLKAPEKVIKNIPTLIDRAVFPGTQGGPHMNTIAAKAVALHEAAQPEFREYAEKVIENAQALADALRDKDFKLITGGTKNHLIMADVQASFGVDGKTVQNVLDKIGLSLNANSIPDDPLPPFRPSGIRLGVPAVTTRGLGAEDMRQLAEWIHQAIIERDSPEMLESIREAVVALAHQYPLP